MQLTEVLDALQDIESYVIDEMNDEELAKDIGEIYQKVAKRSNKSKWTKVDLYKIRPNTTEISAYIQNETDGFIIQTTENEITTTLSKKEYTKIKQKFSDEVSIQESTES